MRALPVAVAVSAAVHVLALLYVETRPHPKHQPPPQVTSIELTPPAPAEPMVVELFDDHTPVNPLPATSLPSQPSHVATGGTPHGRGKEGTTSPGKSATTQGGAQGKEGTTSPLMKMRGKGEGPGLVWNPSDKFNQAFEAYSNSHPPDIPPPPSGELKPSGNGTYKSDEPAFTVKTDRDGTAHIQDKPDVDIHFSGLGFAGRASIDDWAMRKAGIDPYASAKRQWLDKTRDERARIGLANRKEDLARAPEYMQRNVAWAMAHARDDDEKKEALFELWDDCAETGDDQLVAAGDNARRYVVGFIRAHFPAGKGGYTPEDLARLNAQRRSKATFAPY